MALQSADALIPRKSKPDERHLTIIAICFGLAFVTLPTLLFGIWTLHYLSRNPNNRARLSIAAVATLGAIVAYLYQPVFIHQYDQLYSILGQFLSELVISQSAASFAALIREYVILSLLTLPLAPLLGGCMDGFSRLRKKLRLSRTAEEMAAEWDEHEQKREARLEERARTETRQPPACHSTTALLIGTVIDGGALPTGKSSIGVMQRGTWLYLDDAALDEHLFILGATGSGKSTALKRLCAEVLQHTSRDLYVIDGKGEDDFVQEFRQLVWTYKGVEPAVVRLGGPKSGDKYNAFCGTKEAVYNRLAAMVGVQEAEGNATYFADVNRDLLQLVCFAPTGAPADFADVRVRLSLDWLKAAYKGHGEETYIDTLKAADLVSLSARLRPLIREFESVVTRDGFTLHETSYAIFSIKALSIGDSAKRFCRFLIEDIKDFVANRALRPGLALFDEFGVFGSDNIRDVLAQARSKRWGIGLATQDYANLGDEQTARQIIANTHTRLLMGTNFPEELAMQGGTRVQLESSIQSNETGPTGMSSGRLQHTMNVDINRARRFQRGQAYLLRRGYTIAVQIRESTLTEEQQAAVPPVPERRPSSPPQEPPQQTPPDTQPPTPPPDDPPAPPTRRRGKGKL